MRRSSIKLVVLLQDLEFGGTQRYAIHLLNHLNRDLFSPELWVLRGGDDMAPMVKDSGVKIEWLSRSSHVGPTAIWNLARKLKTHKPDVLYTLTVVPNIWGRILGRMARVPTVVTSYRNLVAKQKDRLLWRLSARIICNAKSLRENLIRNSSVDPKRVVVVPNGVDTDYFSPDPNLKAPDPFVVYAGRLVEQKDPFTLLEAFRTVSVGNPKARFLICGKGHLLQDVLEYINSNALQSKIEVIPGDRDLRRHLQRAWVFALASRYEGSPNVLLEAMSMGLPIVSTKVDGIPELIDHGESGLMVEPGHPDSLAGAISSILADDSIRVSMGAKARESAVARFSVEGMVRQTEEALLEAFNEAAPTNEPSD
jgi:L-malate glycosyltransferase